MSTRKRYHVNQNHSNASDSNTGRIGTPLSTISQAVELSSAGDLIIVHDGTYREAVTINKSGTDWKKPIFIRKADSSSSVIIKGSDLVTGWTLHSGNIWKKRWLVNSQMVFANSSPLTQIGGTMATSLSLYWQGRTGDTINDMVAGSFYYDTVDSMIYVWLPDGSNPNSATMEVSVREYALKVDNQKYIEIDGIDVQHSNTSAVGDFAAVILQGEHLRINRSNVSSCDFTGVRFDGRLIELREVYANDCGNSGMTGSSNLGVRVLDCETNNNNSRSFDTNWMGGGFVIKPNEVVKGLYLWHHHSKNNDGSGIWVKCPMSVGFSCNGCYVSSNTKNGIHYDRSQVATLQNNIIYYNNGSGIYLENSSDCMVAHNTIYKNGMYGIAVANNGHASTTDMFVLEGNVFPTRNNQVQGNLLVENAHDDYRPSWFSNTSAELVMPNPDTATTANPNIAVFNNCYSDYNIFARDGRDITYSIGIGGTTHDNLDDWFNAIGFDNSSSEVTVASLLFVDANDPATPNLRLTSSSSSAHAYSQKIVEVIRDADWVARADSSKCTTGAYEI